MSQINQYPNEAFVINDEDFYDVDYWTGSAFESRKISGVTLKNIFTALVSNIYNSDGNLTGNRVVDLAGFTLDYESSSDAVIQIRSANSGVINLVRGTGFKAWSIVKDVDGSEDFRIDRHNGAGAFLDTPIKIYTSDGAIEFNAAYKFPTTDGTAGYILSTDGAGQLSWSPAPSGDNIYNVNGSLTGNRYLDLNNFALFISDLLGSTKFIGGNEMHLVGNSNQPATIKLDAGNGDFKTIEYLTSGVTRWKIEPDDVEIGGDTGANLYFKSYDDAGLVIGVPLKIDRQTGEIYINNQYRLPLVPGTQGYVLTTNGIGGTSWEPVSGIGAGNINTASSQWSKTLPASVPLPIGSLANGCAFFTEADKVAAGTTPYYEFSLQYGRTIRLSGTSGTANINVNGVNYLATFNTSLFQTAVNWVTANQAALNAIGIRVFAIGSGINGRIRFGAASNVVLDAITITNVTTDLSGTLINDFTGTALSAQDHIIVPYVGTPIDGQRLLHTIRANFNISTGSVQYAELGLFRYQNDTIIGSTVQIIRNPHTTGQQVNLETYTNSFVDPFVLGGFYLALRNTSNTQLDFIGGAGILMQTILQKPTQF